jgi:CDP-diacylglycerol--glycerol-3-phosphate 3-phosphatidyltransferase
MVLMIPVGHIPAWIVALIIIRDIVVDGTRNIALSDGIVIAASKLGKRKTLSQNIAVSALIIHYPLFGLNAHLIGMVILYIALVLTIWSGVDYFVKFYRGTIEE